CAYAAAFGTLQVTVAQGVPGLPDLADARAQMLPLIRANQALDKELKGLPEDAPERATKKAEFDANLRKIGKINKEEIKPRRDHGQFMEEVGGVLGRVLLAVALVLIVSKRRLLWLFQVPGLVIIPLVWFWMYPNQSLSEYFSWGVFLAGACIVAQFSFFGEYLPKVFPVHLRGTGGAFATNVGGRMIGTSAAFFTTGVIAPLVSNWLGGGPVTPEKVAYAAGVTGVLVFAVGLIVSLFLPEPPGEEKG